MKVSIITVCYNSEKTIRHTIESVLAQEYNNIEYIIVDGASSDSTISIVKEYGDRISTFISEKDKGIYDAFNKGIALATGDVIGIINSDDKYYSNNAISTIVNCFLEHKVDAVYGDLVYVNDIDSDKIVRYWKSKPYLEDSFRKGFHPPHPTFFVRKEVYGKYGNFDISFKVSADFDLMLRFVEKHKIPTHYVHLPIVKMLTGGESGRSFKNIYIGNSNILKSFQKNGIKINPYIYIYKRFSSKIVQFINRI